MNKLNTNILAAVITIVVFFFLGRLLFLASAQGELEQLQNTLQTTQKTLNERNTELEKLKQTVKSDTVSGRGNTILKVGEENIILRFILENSGNSFKLNTFELLESYFVKTGAEQDMGGGGGQFAAVSESLPELDEQGMPVGMAVESDEEWPGIEIIPVRLTFSATYVGLGTLLTEIVNKLPMSGVRSMDLLLSRTAKGTIVMTFPLAEQN